MHGALKSFPLVIELPVVWGEMDAFGHVNNICYFRYFESARIAYFDKVGMMDLLETDRLGPIVANISCRFKAPLSYPDKIWVGAKIERLVQDCLQHRYVVVSEKLGRVAAEGEGTIVFYDYGAGKKINIPKDLYQKILKFDFLAEQDRE